MFFRYHTLLYWHSQQPVATRPDTQSSLVGVNPTNTNASNSSNNSGGPSGEQKQDIRAEAEKSDSPDKHRISDATFFKPTPLSQPNASEGQEKNSTEEPEKRKPIKYKMLPPKKHQIVILQGKRAIGGSVYRHRYIQKHSRVYTLPFSP